MIDKSPVSSSAAQPTALAPKSLIGRLRGDMLFLVSAIGTALTVLSALQNTLTVASWARALVDGFQSAASNFWALALPWLTVSPRPMDVVYLNMAALFVLMAIGSLSPRAEVPGSWREVNWGRELLAIVGMTLAAVVIMWAGFNSIQEHLDGPAFRNFMSAMDAAKTVEDIEQGGLAYFTEFSAFFPALDSFGQAIGLTSGPLVERAKTDVFLMMALYVSILLIPVFAVFGVGVVFGLRNDSRKTSRWSWLFLTLLAAVMVLSWLSKTWSGFCVDGSEGLLNQLCNLVD